MAGWDGNGIFTKTYSWVQDQLNGIKIRADRHDTNDTDFVNGINNCLTKDGQNAATANLPMGGFKHTAVGKATATNQYATAEQVIDNELIYYTASGTDTYTITPSPAITSYAAGQSFLVNFTNANTGVATININGLGAKSLVKGVSTALASGDIAAGSIKEIVYDGTNFQVKDIASTIADGSITPAKLSNSDFGDFTVAAGVATIDNNAITTAKINNDAVTYAKIQNVSATDKLLGRSTAGAGDIEEITCTSFGRSLIDDADAATARTTLGITGTGGPTVGTPVTTTSGTSNSFTGIASTATLVIVQLNGVSTNGTSRVMLQLGDSGGIETTGYIGNGGYSTNGTEITTGFPISDNYSASDLLYGHYTLTKYNGNEWVASWNIYQKGSNKFTSGGGNKTLSATLDRVALTTVGGTDTFDAGGFNVTYI